MRIDIISKNVFFYWKFWPWQKKTIGITFMNQIEISFTLYPAHRRAGRGNLVSRHSVPYFPPNFWRRNSTPRFGFLPWCQSEEMKILINNYLFSWESNPHSCSPASRRPRLAGHHFKYSGECRGQRFWIYKSIFKNYTI